MLYEPAQFEPLTDEPWDPPAVEDAITAIVADAGAAFDSEALWPAHEWDGWEEPLPLKNLYAIAQAERSAAANGRRRYSLFTGDVGTALFAAACLDLDTRYPIIDVL